MSPIEKLSLIKSFTGDPEQSALLDAFSYSEDPVTDILDTFENQYGQTDMEIPNIKCILLALPTLEDSTDVNIVVKTLRGFMVNLKKILQLNRKGVSKEFCIEIVHKLKPVDRRPILARLNKLPSNSSNPAIFQNFLMQQLQELGEEEELVLATAPGPMGRQKKTPFKLTHDSTGVNVMQNTPSSPTNGHNQPPHPPNQYPYGFNPPFSNNSPPPPQSSPPHQPTNPPNQPPYGFSQPSSIQTPHSRSNGPQQSAHASNPPSYGYSKPTPNSLPSPPRSSGPQSGQTSRRNRDCLYCNEAHRTYRCHLITPQTPLQELTQRHICTSCLGTSHPRLGPHACGFSYDGGRKHLTREMLCCGICGLAKRGLCPASNSSLIQPSGPIPAGQEAHSASSISTTTSQQTGSNPAVSINANPTITSNYLTTTSPGMMLPVSTINLATSINSKTWQGIGTTSPTIGKVRLSKTQGGVTEEITVTAYFDGGSDNSWIDATLIDFASVRQPAHYQIDTMLGSQESINGEAWKVTLSLPNGEQKNVTMLKSEHFRNSHVAHIQRQLISCPVDFAEKHGLPERLSPILQFKKEQVYQTGDCQALVLIGRDLQFHHPIIVDTFRAPQTVGDNIQNFVMLLENQLYPEVLLIGQRLEVPVKLSQDIRKIIPSSFGEKFSGKEREELMISEARVSSNLIRLHPDIANYPNHALSDEDKKELRYMVQEEYSLHNLDPTCDTCSKCSKCYIPLKAKTRVEEGKIQKFLKEIEILPQADGTKMFQGKLILNNNINHLKDNKAYALKRAISTEQQLKRSWASSLRQMNETMDTGLAASWWELITPEEEQQEGRHYLPLSFYGKRDDSNSSTKTRLLRDPSSPLNKARFS